MTAEKTETALTVTDVRRSFGSKQVLRGVSFEVERGSLLGIIGPSGSGKSILLKILANVLPLTSGAVQTNSISIQEVGFMFQEGALFDSLSVFDNVAFPLVNGRVPASCLPKEEREMVASKVFDILHRVGLEKAFAKMPGQLSGGMRRRVSLARALISSPKLVLLDDPTCGLDPVASSVIMKLICDFHAEYNPTMLVISQDLRRLLPISERILALFEGQIVFDGDLRDLRGTEDLLLRNFVDCRFDLDGEQPGVV